MDDTSLFLGSGWRFPPSFTGKGRQASMAQGETDIRESLRLLLSTVPGERVMQPEYGCSLSSMVFETFDRSTLTDVEDRVKRAILFFEPRIIVERVMVDLSREPEGYLSIVVSYRVRATNNRSNIVYPFYFLEGTNL
ncbi:GPW/gp25 family protein [Desulfoluna butyratoxydans]|uniref:Gpw/gp25/anti-adapter protein irad n=1 Tax=Desulfoluna butyratoxydans TaxID=231438 RepID=A0A4U8YNH0_9BACT|nr:GPW/gp25 family protein [Desulfoluna butyratoxydans]VFQ45360.1 gpw/gp25/anti-adapter protein irad [Desulfoluna butyratoxydans]